MKRRGFFGSLLGGIVAAPAIAKSLSAEPKVVDALMPQFKAKVVHTTNDGLELVSMYSVSAYQCFFPSEKDITND